MRAVKAIVPNPNTNAGTTHGLVRAQLRGTMSIRFSQVPNMISIKIIITKLGTDMPIVAMKRLA